MAYSFISPQITGYLKANISAPIFSSIIQDRVVGAVLLGAAGLQLGTFVLNLPTWSCPFLHVIGIPCPGCGLTRAIVALLEGDWQSALTLHAYAPIFVVAIVLIACATLLPSKPRNWFMTQFELVERRTGITAILLIGLVVYWLIRLLFFPEAFINLIKG